MYPPSMEDNPQQIQTLLELLQLSLQPNQQQLQTVEKELTHMSKYPGYLKVLLEIANSCAKRELILAALAQLNNLLRNYHNEQVSAQKQIENRTVISESDF